MNDLARLNELRRRAETVEESARLAELEAEFERRFGTASQLAVYGTLAPGEVNHHIIAGVPGQWHDKLVVRGHLLRRGWGVALGFPALQPAMEGPPVKVRLFVSAQLPQHWARLDEFEGEEYERVLIPVFRADELLTVANIYAWRQQA